MTRKTYRRKPLAIRLLNRIYSSEEGCWLWTGAKTSEGYGVIFAGPLRGMFKLTHRASYEMFRGPIPGGLQIDHLCRVRHCCNPHHMEPVTGKENVSRGNRSLWGVWNRSKTHCPRGHPYSGKNLITVKDGRVCKACRTAHYARYREEGRYV